MGKQIQIDSLISDALYSTSIGVCVVDIEGKIIQTNKYLASTLGYTEEEMVGFDCFSMLPAEKVTQEIDDHEILFREGKNYSKIIKVKKKDGTYTDMNVTWNFVEVDGMLYKMGICQNITELVRTNELLNKVGEQTKVGGWERDLQNNTIFWTEGVLQIYELPIGETPQFDEAELLKFFAEEDLKSLVDSHNFTIKTGRKSEIITRFVTAKGNRKWVKNTTEAIKVDEEVVKLIGTFQDITDEREKEIHLNQSRVRYKTLFENNPSPLFIIDLSNDYKIIDANQSACNLYEYTYDEMISLSAKDLRPKEGVKKFLKNISQEANTSNFAKRKGITRHQKKSGEILDVEVHWRNFLVDDDNVQMVFIDDVTERLKREVQLSETNKFLETLIESAPIAIVMVDKKGVVELWNHIAEETFGWKSEEVIGEVIPYVQKEKHDEFLSNLERGLKAESNFHLELERVTKKGQTIYLREFVAPISNAVGKREKLLLLIEDITDSKFVQNALIESEYKYRNLVETSNDLIWRLDDLGNITFVNKAVSKILGYQPNSLIGNNFTDMLHPKNEHDWEEVLERLSSGYIIENLELLLKHSSGEIVNLSSTLQPTFDKTRTITGYSCYAVDLTQVIEHQSHLETMLKEKEILIKEIHHRVKNNLAVVSGLLSLQAHSQNDDKLLALLTESQSRIQSIGTIHEKLYQNELLSSIELKNYLEQLVSDISETYRSPEKDITTHVIGDEVTLTVNQAVPFGILANELVINAFKYAFEGKNKGRITLSIKKQKKGGVTFAVSDDGVGLVEGFDKKKKGSLGMTLVQSLAQQLDATLEITSTKGATFKISFIPVA